MTPITLGLVGRGWRANFFARLAAVLPDEFSLVGAVGRTPEAAQEMARRWSVPGFTSPAELADRVRPDLVVCAVPWDVNPVVVTELVSAGSRVLCETPPAPDLSGLHALWAAVGSAGMVQVAEQYLLLPGHAARRELVSRGVIGRPTSVQVSSTHGYHAVAMMRGLLGVGFDPVTVSAARFEAPLVDPLTRDGWTDDDEPHPAGTTLATLDFGGGRSGLYDFTDNQWHNRLRMRRIVIRGSRGEIRDDEVISLRGPRTITTSSLVRSQLGHDLNLDGHDTEHLSFDSEVVYRNGFAGLRLMDEEIAIASLLRGCARWIRGDGAEGGVGGVGGNGVGPYPLEQGCQDQAISLAIDESLRTGERITLDRQPWGG